VTAKKNQGRQRRRGGTLELPALVDFDTSSIAVHVYRSELVEERVIAVPLDKAKTSASAAAILAHYLRKADRETFAVLLLDHSCQVLGVVTVAIGSIEQVNITDREVFKPAILRLAEKIVLGHNHPIGTAEPSAKDKSLTKALVRTGRLLDIPVIDHIIVDRSGRYFSFVDHGLMKDES
jgi:DNA repair protein RadC